MLFFVNHVNGCPLRLVDSSGAVDWEATVSPWGEIESISISAIVNNLRLPGQYSDVETGLNYNRYRYYDSVIGSYIGQDPIRLRGGPNTYLYPVNPHRWIDPWGLILADVAAVVPAEPGVYHIELGDEYYTGSGVNIKNRVSDANHPARDLLNNPDVTITTYPVDLGSAAGDNRMTNHVLRNYEQGIMDAVDNVPKAGGSLNQVRAAAVARVDEFAADALNHGASSGAGTVSTSATRAAARSAC